VKPATIRQRGRVTTDLEKARQEFLQDICQNPGDPTLRLVYADWLEDRGAPADLARAEFIRVQIALETKKTHTGRPVDEKLHRALMARERELFREHGAKWVQPFDGLGATNIQFRGGLPHHVDISLDRFLNRENADKLFALGPVQSVRITGSDEQALAGSPELERLATVVTGLKAFEPERVTALAASPHLAHLTSLDLGGNHIGDAGAAALAASPLLAGLTELHLRGSSITDVGVQALADSPHLARLKELRLGYNHITDVGVQALAGSPHLAGLERLYLGGNEIGDAGAAALAAASSRLAGLTELDLTSNHHRLSAAGAAALAAASPHLAGLKKLHLGGNDLGDAGAAALAASPHLAGLTELDLGRCGIGEDGGRALAASPHLSNLVALYLGGNRIGDAGAAALADSPHLASLTTLHLWGNGISAELDEVIQRKLRRPRPESHSQGQGSMR
jgi:uncharacterized protein (TIGR02996 family)